MIDIEHEGHKALYMYYRFIANQTLSFLETRKKKRKKKKREGKIFNYRNHSVYKIRINQIFKWGFSLPLP